MRVSRIITIRQRLYRALWGAVSARGVLMQQFEHAITAADYGPVRGESIAARVDIPRYRNVLPALPPGATQWVLLGAVGGIPEWDTPTGELIPGDIGFEDDVDDPQIWAVDGGVTEDGEPDIPRLRRAETTVLNPADPDTITLISSSPSRKVDVSGGEIVRR